MKHYYFFLLCLLLALTSHAQTATSFVVQGDLDKFYPIVFFDANFNNNQATEIQLGRSNVHTDQTWRGSLIAKFRVHTTNWGNGSQFIDADVRQYDPLAVVPFIAGWADASSSNNTGLFVIWLRGGSTTYYAYSSTNTTITIYDGIAHPLPYQETNGPARTYKTAVDPYVNFYGESKGGNAFFTGTGNNYFGGNLGIGTFNPGNYKLAVAGPIHVQSVQVDMNDWSDFVFNPSYNLASLPSVKTYLDQNHHLPNMPSEKEVVKDGVNVGYMLKLQTQKIEELTLYLIEKDQQLTDQKKEIEKLKQLQETRIAALEKALKLTKDKD